MPNETNSRCPYYTRIPKERRANLQWRLAVCRRAMVDAEFREGIRQMCADDPLFFILGFVWLVEPRGEDSDDPDAEAKPVVVPFIPYDHQERAALAIAGALGKRDIGIEKSRSEGATWLILAFFLWLWLFKPMCYLGVVSKDELTMDSSKAGALMSKLAWLITRMPAWMIPRGYDEDKHRSRSEHTITNPENGSLFSGFAATGTIASGDRLFAILVDELSKFALGKKGADYQALTSVQAVSNCRIIVGTPYGSSGAYYDVMHEKTSNMVKVVLDWKENPTKNRGMYRMDESGVVHDLNKSCPLTQRQRDQLQTVHGRLKLRGYRVADKVRSPWLDDQCERPLATPQTIAQEVEMDYGGSTDKPFDAKNIELLIARHARAPVQVGVMKPVIEGLRMEPRWIRSKGGNCDLWCPLGGPLMTPPKRAYGAGVDVAFGSGGDFSSNSVLFIGDLATGEQVFQFVSSSTMIPEFAWIVAAACKWFWNAMLNWDSKGAAGTMFTRQILEYCKYYEIMYTDSAEGEKKPGTYHHDDESKSVYLNDTLEDSLCDELIIRSEDTLAEFGQYGFKNGKITHMAAVKTTAEGSKGRAHGDRATAAAMFNIVRRQLKGSVEPTPERPPDNNGPPVRVSWSCASNRILDNLESKNHHRATGPYANRPRPIR